jgi:tetratricopeptide (TPR) repeat protein
MRREILARTGRLEYRDALVRTLHWRAQLLMEYGEPEAVRRALDEAEEAFSGLMEVQPDPEVVRDLASLLIQRARWREGEEELSVQRFRLSRVMDLRDWLQEAGSDLDEELGSLLAEHAAACAEAGNRDGEVEAAQAALALLEPLVGNRDKEKILTVLEDLRLRCRVSDSRSG